MRNQTSHRLLLPSHHHHHHYCCLLRIRQSWNSRYLRLDSTMTLRAFWGTRWMDWTKTSSQAKNKFVLWLFQVFVLLLRDLRWSARQTSYLNRRVLQGKGVPAPLQIHSPPSKTLASVDVSQTSSPPPAPSPKLIRPAKDSAISPGKTMGSKVENEASPKRDAGKM